LIKGLCLFFGKREEDDFSGTGNSCLNKIAVEKRKIFFGKSGVKVKERLSLQEG